MTQTNLGLFDIVDTQGKSTIRTIAVKSNERSFTIDINRINVLNNFNIRKKRVGESELDYEKRLQIPELADQIFENNGLIKPLVGDFKDGTFYITDGERRFRAINYLLSLRRETYPNGNIIAHVYVLANPTTMTPLERFLQTFADNATMLKSPMEIAHGYLRMKKEHKCNNETIGKLVGASRQHVDMYIKAAIELPETVQEAIDEGATSITVEIAKLRPAATKKVMVEVDVETGEVTPEKTDDELISECDTKKELEDKTRSNLPKSEMKEDKGTPAMSIYDMQQNRALIRQELNAIKEFFNNAGCENTAYDFINTLPDNKELTDKILSLFTLKLR